ncbi:MAG: hypothetical protein MUF87_04585 [Anaerolineae bacterium]|nr:hypothetical protein [Anaerolineae bacterium]
MSKRFLAVLTTLLLVVAGIVWASPAPQANLFQLFLLNLESDLNTLADEVYSGSRPFSWIVNEDVTSTKFTADLWFNTEQLADEVFGLGIRPPEWFGATTANAELLARNVRHDIELIADQVYGDPDLRPEGWVGARPVFRCSRTIQNILRILDIEFNTRPETPDSVINYCASVRDEITDELFPPVSDQISTPETTQSLLSGLRGDLERLADELLGLETRPSGWIGNRDATSSTFTTELFTDLERLTDDRLGFGERPEGWSGTVQGSPSQTYSNLRFNLESLADQTLGAGVRPTGWQGDNLANRCEPMVQILVTLVNQTVAPLPLPEVQDVTNRQAVCLQYERAANDLYENPPIPVEEDVIDAPEDERLRGRSRYAFAYLDVAALQYMGVMPIDTEFRAWYRNFNTSNMMFVTGEGFAVFIDRRFTTLSEDAFRTLDTLEGRRPLTFCDASWCNGPGPTPTPTGDGPLALLLNQSTPIPTRSPIQIEEEGKTLVSWNNIRVRYLLDVQGAAAVQVTLEICSDTNQTACEPVNSVFNSTTGVFEPVISVFNGLNVYQLPYGYRNDLIIESASRFSRDVWISEPAFRQGS